MSQKLLNLLIKELCTVRVRCTKCKRGVIEVEVARLDAALDQGACRFCGHEFHARTGADPFNDLKLALDELKKMQNIEVSFVVPAEE